MRWIIPLLLCTHFASLASEDLLQGTWGEPSSVHHRTVGYSFTVKKHPLRLVRIGVLNPMGGIQRPMRIGIWNESGTLLASATISSPVNGSAVLQNNFWWVALAIPVTLEPYTTYRVACQSDATSYHNRSSLDWVAISSAVTVNNSVFSTASYSFTYPDLTSAGIIVGPNLTFDVLPYDTTQPVLTLIGDNPQTIYRGTAFTDLGATVTDDFDATRTITGSGSVDTSTVGSYTLTYSAQDEVGNVATPVTRTVNVVLNPTGDEDNDGLNNTEEANLGTNPYQRDTDSDGVNDLREVGDGTDPLDPASFNSLSKGLVAYYPFNGNAKDESGNGRNGAIVRAQLVPDRFGTLQSSLGIDGGAQYATLPLGFQDFAGEFTISCWVNFDGFTNDYPTILSGDNGFLQLQGLGPIYENLPDFGGQGMRGHLGYSEYPQPYDISTRTIFYSTQSVTPSTWHHVVVTKTAGSTTILVNGQALGSTASGSLPLTAGSFLYVGNNNPWGGVNNPSNTGNSLFGEIDDIRIYSKALSTAEVALLFADEKYNGAGLEGAATKSPFEPTTAANWSTSGAGWSVDTATTHDGVDSVKAQTPDGQSTYREYTVTGPAVVDFWWKASSEQNYDTFSYSLNGVNQETISGEVDWTYRTLTLPAGTHTIRWTYTKDNSGSVGQDAGWLDDFAVYPATATLSVRDGATALAGTVTVDFGDADIGSAGFTKSLTFSNEGFVPLEVELSLPGDPPFTFEGGSFSYPLLIGRGESVEVPISLSSAVLGTKTAQLAILAPDSTTPAPQITLTGVVLGPVIGVSAAGAPITSGQNVDLGLAPRNLQFTISNTGNVGDLLISGISVTGNFQITQQPQASIPPQGNTTFTVLAQGGSSGVQSGTVTITSNDTLSETFSFSIGSKSLFSIDQGIAADSVATSGTGGASGWDFASTQLPSGSTGQALKTGTTPNNGGSALEIVTETAGVVSWTWKVSTQENFDWLLCEVDGQEVAGISTKNGVWQTQVVNVPAGATIRWVYRKDGSGSIGEDAGYLADVEFRSFAANQSFSEWGQPYGIFSFDSSSPKLMKACFGWLGGYDPVVGLDAGHHVPIMEGGRLKYRFAMSKTADGTQRVLFSSDLSSWTSRGMSQRILSEDGNRMVVEATAPSGTKGFFKVVGSGDTAPIGMVTVLGGMMPMSSTLANVVVPTLFIGQYEVTWEEWQEIRNWGVSNGYSDLAGVGGGSAEDHPVRDVSWYDAVKWCNARSEKEGLTAVYHVDGAIYRSGQIAPVVNRSANGYRLPTEAEWEWAARGGTKSQGYMFSGGNNEDAVAWFYNNSNGAAVNQLNGRGTWPVGQKLANELGIHDMSGNVREWCEDVVFTSSRRLWGGSWILQAGQSAIGNRVSTAYSPNSRANNFGFRVARNAED